MADAACLTLPPSMGGESARLLRQSLLALKGQGVEIDASQVVRPSTLDIQVLLSARANWLADGASFRITVASDGLRQALAVLGIAPEQINLEDVAS